MSVMNAVRLLAAQVEVRMAHEVDPGDPAFNCGGYLDLSGILDAELLDRAVRQVESECEAVRLRLLDDAGPDDEAYCLAVVSDPSPDPLEHVDLSQFDDAERRALDHMAADLGAPVVLTHDRLVRQALFLISPERHLLYLRSATRRSACSVATTGPSPCTRRRWCACGLPT